MGIFYQSQKNNIKRKFQKFLIERKKKEKRKKERKKKSKKDRNKQTKTQSMLEMTWKVTSHESHLKKREPFDLKHPEN